MCQECAKKWPRASTERDGQELRLNANTNTAEKNSHEPDEIKNLMKTTIRELPRTQGKTFQSVLPFTLGKTNRSAGPANAAGATRSTTVNAVVNPQLATLSNLFANGTFDSTALDCNGTSVKLNQGRPSVGDVLTQLSCGVCEANSREEPIWSSSVSIREAKLSHSSPSLLALSRLLFATGIRGSNRSVSVGRNLNTVPAKPGNERSVEKTPCSSR
ncbi:uncharacterized protein UBRO_00226 [Ustilago bromivora]|uniref:Uncharacterized protein n=1 Tax=Ustilago bromivora TaxID=307758 RepID=A0A1K0FY03_9BASI|nr:uncharacterized protein UBRO_00226 [Ustilago bromivora]SYW76696.1 uncharacterized protein UBRO2_01533 [Ustilago bromivora]